MNTTPIPPTVSVALTGPKVFCDPRELKEEDLPVIVLCDDLRGFVGWGIKDHTNGNYNHVFILHKPGTIISQDFGGLHVKSIDTYLNSRQMLKFWRIKDLTLIEKKAILDAIDTRIKLPFIKRMYDYLGLVGQFFHIKWINSPWQTFCSEQVNFDYIQPVPRARLMNIKEPSPSELDNIFKQHPDIMECLGYWFEI